METLELNPKFTDAALLLSELALQLGSGEHADVFLLEVLQNNPHDDAALRGLIRIEVAAGQFDRALIAGEGLANMFPEDVEVRQQLAHLYLVNGDLEKSEREACKLLVLTPNDWHVHFLLGSIYSTTGLVDRALKSLRRAAELAPEEWRPFNDLGKLLVEQDDPRQVREGVSHLETARRLSGEEPRVLFNLALGRVKLNQGGDAMQIARGLTRAKDVSAELLSRAEDLLRQLEAGQVAHA